MHLSDEEKAWLDGREGEGRRLAMEVIVEVGRSFGAERLIPVTSAHILGHFGSLHQAGIDFFTRLAPHPRRRRERRDHPPCLRGGKASVDTWVE